MSQPNTPCVLDEPAAPNGGSLHPAGYAACPFCGCQGEPVTSHIGPHHDKHWWIWCKCCGACGPTDTSLDGADVKWRKRHNEKGERLPGSGGGSHKKESNDQ